MNNRIVPVVLVTQDALKSTAAKPRRGSIIREFALNTSTHGLPGIARGQSKHNRIFWSVSFLCFLGVMIYFVIVSIQAYFDYPTQTILSYVVQRSQAFPAVTFCNYAPTRYDRIIKPFLNFTNSLNITNTNDTSTFTPVQANALRDFLRGELNANRSVANYLFTIDIMLIDCVYNEMKCTTADFISFISSSYGLCYTFNAQTKNTNASTVRYTNDNSGAGRLVLRLYTHSNQYIPYLSEEVSAGMVAMIHDNRELPRVDVAGIYLAPGRRHKLGYRKKANYFLSSPYTDCTDKVPLVMQALFDRYESADYTYSQTICNTLCTQAYIYQQCGCVSPLEWSARSIVVPGTNTIIQAPLCYYTDACYSSAATTLSNSTSLWNEFCSGCTQECLAIDFTITSSSAAAPSTVYYYVTKNFVESIPDPSLSSWETDWETEVQNNYVALEVVCESNQIENYIQAASISATDVLSNVGGQSGLWIGVSFLSIMELVEMFYRLFRYEYRIIRGIR